MFSFTSLVNTPRKRLATCVYCGSTHVTALHMTLTDGSVVMFNSCHRCEGTCWSDDNGQLPLRSVLDRVRKPAR